MDSENPAVSDLRSAYTHEVVSLDGGNERPAFFE